VDENVKRRKQKQRRSQNTDLIREQAGKLWRQENLPTGGLTLYREGMADFGRNPNHSSLWNNPPTIVRAKPHCPISDIGELAHRMDVHLHFEVSSARVEGSRNQACENFTRNSCNLPSVAKASGRIVAYS
jgi:hypothetical protein